MIIHDTSKVHTLKFIWSEHFTCRRYLIFFCAEREWAAHKHILFEIHSWFFFLFFVIHNPARCVSLFPTSVDCRCFWLNFFSMYSNLTFTSCGDFFMNEKQFEMNTKYELVFFTCKGLTHVVHEYFKWELKQFLKSFPWQIEIKLRGSS
jgi:hypothetical protein